MRNSLRYATIHFQIRVILKRIDEQKLTQVNTKEPQSPLVNYLVFIY